MTHCSVHILGQKIFFCPQTLLALNTDKYIFKLKSREGYLPWVVCIHGSTLICIRNHCEHSLCKHTYCFSLRALILACRSAQVSVRRPPPPQYLLLKPTVSVATFTHSALMQCQPVSFSKRMLVFYLILMSTQTNGKIPPSPSTTPLVNIDAVMETVIVIWKPFFFQSSYVPGRRVQISLQMPRQ